MKKILIADRDESLKDAFRVVFPSDEFEILFTSNGREAERVGEDCRPEIYILNTRLEERDGIAVYRNLKERNKLRDARFFFIRDESAAADLSGFPVEGVIDKPINFFKVHQMIDREENLPEMGATRKPEKGAASEERPTFTTSSAERIFGLEQEMRQVIMDTVEGIKAGFVDRAAPLITRYIEQYAREIVSEAAEKIVREEMDKMLNLLRESRK